MNHTTRTVWILAAALAPPALVRSALLLRGSVALRPMDGVGIASDASAMLVAAAGFGAALRRRPGVALFAALSWGLLNYANYEHVRELGGGLQLTFSHYLASPIFFRGSVLAPSAPQLLAIAVALPTLLLGWVGRPAAETPCSGRRETALIVLGVILGIAVQLVPADPTLHRWRQRHFLHEMVETALVGIGNGPVAEATLPPELAADLAGAPRVALPGRARNVLLIVLEGLPATVLEGLSANGARADRVVMPRFSAVADRGLVFENFVLHQRQTNRGLYALLCGDYPRLDGSLAKMTAYSQDSSHDCLPRVLGSATYRTAYVQGAPLVFMYKDAFARSAGFERVHGNTDFEAPIYRSYWGVDDRTLLRTVREFTRELAGGDAPWFIAVLSVGTHHPAVVPPELLGDREAFPVAVRYLDEALGDFVDGLRADGRLDDTIVLISSDESKGSPGATDLERALSQNWGPLVALMPEGLSGVVSEPYGQSDVALSILDYLGIDPATSPFVGRSLFRRYQASRRIYFGNVFLRSIGGVDSDGSVFRCRRRLRGCRSFVSHRRFLLVPDLGREARDLEQAELARLRQVVHWSRRGTDRTARKFGFDLLGARVVPILGESKQALMEGQNLDVPAQSRVDVDVVARLLGQAGTLELTHHLHEKLRGRLVEHIFSDLGPGDEVSIRYSFSTPRDMGSLKFKLSALAQGPRELRIQFVEAGMRVAPLRQRVTRMTVVRGPHFDVRRTQPPRRKLGPAED